ncbi:hypothetical protein Dip510_001122 [Elusimicrobium posterum]|uniref:hypothetical protein n=1 Tax=Elusimicrobium posterum TaxID=3116653 RepID=UPI003C70A24E
MKNKKEKNVIYPVPEAVFDPGNYREEHTDSKKTCVFGYELVYLLDQEHKYAFVFGSDNSASKELQRDEDALHEKFHKQAFSGNKVVYNWHVKGDQPGKTYQTILIPCR